MKPRPAKDSKSAGDLQEIIGRLIEISTDGSEGLALQVASNFRLNFRSEKERDAARRRLMKFVGKNVCIMTSLESSGFVGIRSPASRPESI